MSLPTLVTVSTLYNNVISNLTYMICDLCHMFMGVTSNIYCTCKYCTFTVTSIIAYTLLLTRRLSSLSNTMKPLTEKIYEQGKLVEDMTYLNIKSEETETNTNKLFYLMNNITLHICHDEYTAVTFDTIMTNNSWQQRE